VRAVGARARTPVQTDRVAVQTDRAPVQTDRAPVQTDRPPLARADEAADRPRAYGDYQGERRHVASRRAMAGTSPRGAIGRAAVRLSSGTWSRSGPRF
jgi:hypothetical protein